MPSTIVSHNTSVLTGKNITNILCGNQETDYRQQYLVVHYLFSAIKKK